MKILFKRVKLTNFLSFGNNTTIFDYESGINLVTGIVDGSVTKNGAGKSTLIVDSISYALYGKPLRGSDHINKEELINKTNGKNCLVELDFSIDKDEYIIQRGIKPNIFTISHNGAEVKFDSTKNTQEWLSNKLGISHTSFSNIVVLNINSSLPFLGMDTSSKRKVIEDIISLNVYGKMSDSLKKLHLDAKGDMSISEAEISSKYRTLQVAEESRKKILVQQKSFDDEKQRICNDIQASIIQLQNDIQTQKSLLSISDYVSEIEKNNLVIRDIRTKLGLLSEKRSELNKTVKDAKLSLENLEHETTCSRCRTVLADSPLTQHFMSECRAIMKDGNEAIASITIKIEKGNTKLYEYEKIVKTLNDDMRKQDSQKSKISTLESQLKMKVTELSKEKNRVLDLASTISEEKIKEFQDSIKESEQDLKDATKDFAYTKFLRTILGEEGIRKFVLNNVMPYFNNKINHYLKVMGCDYSLIFDNNLTETIISRNRDERTYGNFSSGEKKRIDLSILLALMDLAKMQNSIDTNLFVLDEVLDTSMDNDGVECFLEYLKTDFKTTYPDKCVYIITHRNDVSGDTFDRMVYLRKVKSFTIIDKIVDFNTK